MSCCQLYSSCYGHHAPPDERREWPSHRQAQDTYVAQAMAVAWRVPMRRGGGSSNGWPADLDPHGSRWCACVARPAKRRGAQGSAHVIT